MDSVPHRRGSAVSLGLGGVVLSPRLVMMALAVVSASDVGEWEYISTCVFQASSESSGMGYLNVGPAVF